MGETVERSVVRCWSCSLMQYETMSGKCRRCGIGLIRADDVEQAIASAEPAAVAAPLVGGFDRARFTALRKARNLTVRALAIRVNRPRTWISKIEHGHSIPRPSSLYLLSNALNCSVGEMLFDPSGDRLKAEAELLADPFLAEMAGDLARLDDTARNRVLCEAIYLDKRRRAA